MSKLPTRAPLPTLQNKLNNLYHVVDPDDTTDDPTGTSFKGTGQQMADVVFSASNVAIVYDSDGIPTFFSTITLALAAASSGETILIFADITENITLKNGVNINGRGHSLSGSTTDTIIGVGVTMKIYNWNVVNTTSTKFAINLSASSDVETPDCTFNSTLCQ